MLQNFFSSLLMMRENELECLHLAKTSQFSLTFAGSTRSLPKKEPSERPLQLGWLWPCTQIVSPDWKGLPRANPLAFWSLSSATREKSFITSKPDSYDGVVEWNVVIADQSVDG
jgi:hypothetical protein